MLLLAAVCAAPVMAQAPTADLKGEFESLAGAEQVSGQQWFDLATKAREAGAFDMARDALAKSLEAGVSPLRASVERARLAVAEDDADSAVAELRSVFEQGFTGVSLLTSDAVINSLAGDAGYDQLIADMSEQAYPCPHQEGFSDFDFWIGEWDVHVANGTYAGSNVITPEQRGCVLVERWTGASGTKGMSINYKDMITGEWVQIWNSEGGTQINIRGGLNDDGMAMEGTIHYVGNGTTAPFRALWTPLEDGRVRQYFEQSNDGGKTWVPWFEGFYTRKAM